MNGVTRARRIVVKIGSSSLTRPDGGLDLNRIDQVAGMAAQWCRDNHEILIVSSGAVAAGRTPLGITGRLHDLATVQALSLIHI